MQFDYDVAVIGAGAGGYETAVRAARKGKHCCIIEQRSLGGVCLHEGCLPVKTMLYTAGLIARIHQAEELGITIAQPQQIEIDWRLLVRGCRRRIQLSEQGIRHILAENGVELLEGEAIVEQEHKIRIGKHSISSEFIILAAGSKPMVPDLLKEMESCILPQDILQLPELPKRLAILGGGAAGVEYATFFRRMGCHTTLIEREDRLLPNMDEELSDWVQELLEKEGVEIITSAKTVSADSKQLLVLKDGVQRRLTPEKVLNVCGRTGNLDCISKALLLKTEKGFLRTDAQVRTEIPSIYAIGDITGRGMTAHAAVLQGTVAVDSICGKTSHVRDEMIPAAVFTDPEIASVGLTEHQAAGIYPQLRVGRFSMEYNARCRAEGAEQGVCKVLVDNESGKLVGVHLCGENASEWIGIAAGIMAEGLKAEVLLQCVFPHPTASESLKEAIIAAIQGRPING